MPTLPAPDAGSSDARRPGETRALLRIVATQSENSNPLVAIAALALIFTMYGRVETWGLMTWAAMAVVVGVTRHLMSRRIRLRLEDASEADVERDLRLTIRASAINSVMMGTAFWLIAASGDMYVRMIVTLVSLVHMAAVLLYLMPRVTDRLICTAGNVVQGTLFWLGVGNTGGPHWELLVVYCGLFWCGMVSGREQLRQFRESLRMRDENQALLQGLQRERAAVQAALEEARLANQGKNRFLAAASHDLRQPLHALTMFLGTLGFHVPGEDGKRLLGRVNDTLRVLEEQFNSLLDLSRFDAGAVNVNPRAFRLDELLRKIGDEFRPQAEARGLGLQMQVEPALAWSDPLLLGRLLRNLLDNAVHYTTQGSVTVQLRPAAAGFTVSIQDTGPGIAPDQQASIFDEYVQLENPARQRERGVGLGLAIVKRIDQLLGLNLSLQSAVGSGSCFAIRVPAAAQTDRVIAPSAPAINPLAFRLQQQVWLVDDDPIALEGLEAQLAAWGATVRCFRDAPRMLAELREAAAAPDWILTDDMLGETLSGLELARQVLAMAPVRVALVTGNTEPLRLTQLRASGLPVIVKPAAPEQLMNLFGTTAAAPSPVTAA